MVTRLLIFIFLILSSSFAMPNYTLEKVPQGYVLTVSVPPIQYKEINLQGKTTSGITINENFTKVSIKGFADSYDNIGGPQLITSSFKLAFEGDLPELKVLSIKERKITLSKRMYPTQELPTFSATQSPLIQYDESKYQSRNSSKEYASLSKPFTIRNQGGISLIINPLSYNAPENTLTQLEEYQILIKMKHPSKVRSGGSQHYDTYLREIFQNLKESCDRSVPSEAFRNKEVYAIVVSDQYADNPDLKRFIEFRKQDYEVVVKTVTECGGVNPAGVNAFLKDVQPTFALFVGWYRDFLYQQGVTPLNNSWILTYLYYQSYGEFDPHPDFHLGLFFVRDAEALKNAVDKTIYTANNLEKMGNGYVAFTGHDMKMGPGVEHIEEFFDEIEEEYWDKMDIDLTKIYVARNPEMDADICVQKMNEGVRFINYNGHGWEYGWVYKQQNGNVNWTSKYGLENWGKIENSVYPFVLSCACLTGNFMWEGAGDMSWAETWLGHKGLATAFIGSQQSSSFNQHALNRGMVHRIYTNEMTQYGVMMDYAKEYTYDSLGARFGDIGAQEYHLFGDPAIETMVKAEPVTPTTKTAPQNSFAILHNSMKRVTLTVPQNGEYNVTLVTVNGREIYTRKSTLEKGIHTLNFNSSEIANGLYLLKLKNNEVVLREKIILN